MGKEIKREARTMANKTEARRILRNAALHCYHSGNLLFEGYQLTDEQRSYRDAFNLLCELWQFGCVL